MTTTTAALQGWDSIRLAFSVVIEGLPLAFTTADADTITNMAETAWLDTDWDTASFWSGGLEILGTVNQEVEWFHPQIRASNITLKIHDVDGTVASTLLKLGDSAAKKTYLTATLDNNDLTATVQSTSAFAANGTIYIGNETIAYSGKTASTFTGLTRARYTLWQTNGGAGFAYTHKLNPNSEYKLQVRSSPRTHYNRTCWVYLHHYENGSWSSKSDAVLVFVGRIKRTQDNGDGSFSIEVRSIEELLEQHVFLQQFKAQVEDGLYFEARHARIKAFEGTSGPVATLSGTGASLDYGRVRDKITEQLTTWTSGGSLSFTWSIGSESDGRRNIMVVDATITLTTELHLALHFDVWRLLGFDPETQGSAFAETDSGTVYHLYKLQIPVSVAGTARLEAPFKPILQLPSVLAGSTLSIRSGATTGTYAEQPVLPDLGGTLSTADGFLQLGDEAIVAVDKTGDTSFTIIKDVTDTFRSLGFSGGGLRSIAPVRLGDGPNRLMAKQVWIEKAPAKEVILRMILSSDVTNYNHSTYDKNGLAMGLQIPANAIDIDAFDHNLPAEPILLFISKSESFAEILESLLATYHKFLLFKPGGGSGAGKLTIRAPRLDGPNIAAAWTLTEANKARPDDRIQTEYASDSIINRMQLQYKRNVAGQFMRTVTVEDLPSITDFGQRKTVTVKANGIDEDAVQGWIDETASYALFYFSREMEMASRTYNRKLIEMVPCDTLLITDNYAVDTTDGTRGIASVPAWLVSTSFDFKRMTGVAKYATLSEGITDRVAAWGPACMVDDTANSGGFSSGYNSATATLRTYARRYSHSTQGVDASNFAANDVIDVVEISPANTASPTQWQRIASSISGSDILLASALSSPSFDTAKKYVIRYADHAQVVQDQKKKSFTADDATNEVSSGIAAYQYGGNPNTVAAASLNYTRRFVRHPDFADDTAESYGVDRFAEMWLSLNTLLSHKTRVVIANDTLPTNATHNTSATFKWVYGPIWAPCMGRERNLLIRVRASHSTAARNGTIRVYASNERPTGAAVTTTSYPASGNTSTDITVSDTSLTWQTEKSFAVSPIVFDPGDGGPPGCWITIEISAGQAGDTVTLNAVTIMEAGLS